MKHRLLLILIITSLACTAQATPPDAEAIITRAYELRRVDDQIATLTFTFSAPDKDEQRLVYTMVWKNMKGRDGYDDKTIFFTEYPANKRGTAYLGWLASADSARQDDEWMYLPELHRTRRMAHRDHDHDDEEFGRSLLSHQQLDPRPPQLDTHTYIGEQEFAGRMHYLVASTPKKQEKHGGHHMGHHMTARTVRWIDEDSYHIDRVQYYDDDDREMLDMRIRWTRVGDYSLWKTVTAVDPGSHATTTLDIKTIKINSGLQDRDFSRRNLERGSSYFK